MVSFDAYGQLVPAAGMKGRRPRTATAAQPHPHPSSSLPASVLSPDLLQPLLSSFLAPSSSACPVSFALWLSLPPAVIASHVRNVHEAALLHAIAAEARELDGLLHAIVEAVLGGERIDHCKAHLPHCCAQLSPLHEEGGTTAQKDGGTSSESSSEGVSSSSSSSISSPSSPTRAPAVPPPPPPPPSSRAARAAVAAVAPSSSSVRTALSPLLGAFSECDYAAVHRPTFFAELQSALERHVSSTSALLQRLTASLLSLQGRLASLSSFHELNERMSEELRLEGCTQLADAKRTVAALEAALIDRLTALLSAQLTPQPPEEEEEEEQQQQQQHAAAGATFGLVPPSPAPSSSASGSTSSSSLSPGLRLDVILGVAPAHTAGVRRSGRQEDVSEPRRALSEAAEQSAAQSVSPNPQDDSPRQPKRRRRNEAEPPVSKATGESDEGDAQTPIHESTDQPCSSSPSPAAVLPPPPFASARVLFGHVPLPWVNESGGASPVDRLNVTASPPHAAGSGGEEVAVSSIPQPRPLAAAVPPSSPSFPPLYERVPSSSVRSAAAFSSQPTRAGGAEASAASIALRPLLVRRSLSARLSVASTPPDVAMLLVSNAMAAVAVDGWKESDVADDRARTVDEAVEASSPVQPEAGAAMVIVRCSQESGSDDVNRQEEGPTAIM